MSELQRVIEFDKAWDRRSSDPKKDYGVHGVDMRWYVKGPLGVIQFVVYTNWMLSDMGRNRDKIMPPMPADIGYHSPRPMYEGQGQMDPCALLPQGKCYYDGSSLNAERYFDILVAQGGEALWVELEKEYARRFEEQA